MKDIKGGLVKYHEKYFMYTTEDLVDFQSVNHKLICAILSVAQSENYDLIAFRIKGSDDIYHVNIDKNDKVLLHKVGYPEFSIKQVIFIEDSLNGNENTLLFVDKKKVNCFFTKVVYNSIAWGTYNCILWGETCDKISWD